MLISSIVVTMVTEIVREVSDKIELKCSEGEERT